MFNELKKYEIKEANLKNVKGGALNAYLRLAGETQGDILGSLTPPTPPPEE